MAVSGHGVPRRGGRGVVSTVRTRAGGGGRRYRGTCTLPARTEGRTMPPFRFPPSRRVPGRIGRLRWAGLVAVAVAGCADDTPAEPLPEASGEFRYVKQGTQTVYEDMLIGLMDASSAGEATLHVHTDDVESEIVTAVAGTPSGWGAGRSPWCGSAPIRTGCCWASWTPRTRPLLTGRRPGGPPRSRSPKQKTPSGATRDQDERAGGERQWERRPPLLRKKRHPAGSGRGPTAGPWTGRLWSRPDGAARRAARNRQAP